MTDDEILEMWDNIPLSPIRGVSHQIYDRALSFARAIAAKEREECALICDDLATDQAAQRHTGYYVGIEDGERRCAAAIRARVEP